MKQRIALKEIEDVDISRYDSPTRLTLKLRVPGKLGKQVVFIPKGVVLMPSPGRRAGRTRQARSYKLI